MVGYFEMSENILNSLQFRQRIQNSLQNSFQRAIESTDNLSVYLSGYSNLMIFFLPFIVLFYLLVSEKFEPFKNEISTSYFEYSENLANNRIVKAIKTYAGEYSPPFWYNAHLGTLIPFGHDPILKFQREIFTNNEIDGQFAVDWYPKKPKFGSKCNICVFLPGNSKFLSNNFFITLYLIGLGLSSKHKFAQKFLEYMESNGYYCVVINARGIEHPLTTSK